MLGTIRMRERWDLLPPLGHHHLHHELHLPPRLHGDQLQQPLHHLCREPLPQLRELH